MTIAILIAFGISNGVFFAPASEHVYFGIYSQYGYFSFWSWFFAAWNSVGHVLLFLLAKSLAKIKNSVVKGVAKSILTNISVTTGKRLETIDPYHFSVILLRCIPFFHSAVSIMAAFTNVGFFKFTMFTFIGNFAFAAILNLAFHQIVGVNDLDWLQISIGLVAISAASIFLKHVVMKLLGSTGKQ